MADGATVTLDDIVVHSRLADGTAVCLRMITPDDAAQIRDGIAKLSADARYMRFFSPVAAMPDAVVARLADVDGHDHIGWGAICTECEGTPAIGAVHAVRLADGSAIGEYSVAVLDAFQGQGLARMMTAAMLIQCAGEGLTMLDVHILSENAAAKALVKSLGGEWQSESAGVAEYCLDVAGALAVLRADRDARGVQDVFAQLGGASMPAAG